MDKKRKQQEKQQRRDERKRKRDVGDTSPEMIDPEDLDVWRHADEPTTGGD